MSDPIHVTFFRSATGTMGGSHKMLLRLLRQLDKETFNVTVVCQRWDTFCNKLSEENVTIQIIPYPGILDTFGGRLLELPLYRYPIVAGRILQYSYTVKDIIAESDIIWTGPRTFLFIFPAQVRQSTKTIVNYGLLVESSGKWKYVNEICLRYTDYVFIESETQAKRLLTDSQYSDYRSKFTIFNKGIDTTTFDPHRYQTPESDGTLTVGIAALLNPRKRIEDFLTAAAMILDEGYKVQFKIAGEPARTSDHEYQQQLFDFTEELGITDSVDFLGWVDEIPAFYSELDVFVLTSKNEGIPGAVREALAMEVPVVATDVGGTSEVVRDNETGFLVEPEDPDAIVEAIDYLLENPNERDEMGTRGRELIVSEYSIESYIANYEAFLKEIAKE